MRHELYGGRVVIDYDPTRHYYSIESKRLISVTGALNVLAKPALIYWAVNKACDQLQEGLAAGYPITAEDIENARKAHIIAKTEAATTGKEIHAWVESYVKTGESTLPKDEKVLNGVLAFLRWRDEHSVKVLESERLVYSRTYDYVGTLDAIVEIDGEKKLVDFKTSGSSDRLEYRLQTAAYLAALMEESDEDYSLERILLRFDKNTGDFEVKTHTDFLQDLDAFLGLLSVKKRELAIQKNNYGGPK